MYCFIDYKEQTDSYFTYILDKLPTDISKKIKEYQEKNNLFNINEIRIKSNSYLSFLINSKTVTTDIFVYKDEIEKIIFHLCTGSIYAHLDTIRLGYISVGNGIRAGICGKAILEGNEISGINDISSINIRIPQKIPFAGEYVFKLLKDNLFNISLLIYSAPGVGKTTILRDLSLRLSNYKNIRFAIIDSREEITPFFENTISADIYLSYPKGLAIELATKSMTPQLIICDEISSKEECMSILNSLHSGVNIIATTHASTFEELMKKEILSEMIAKGVFNYSLGVKREKFSNKYVYQLNRL